MLAMIRENLVRKKRWISDEELSVAVAMGQMLPGPFVPNYVQYIGFRLRGLKGAIVSGVAFLLPCFSLMVLLSFLYFRFSMIPGLQSVFKGVGPAVTALILWATFEIGKTSLKDWRGIIIGVFAFLCLMLKNDVLLTILACGLLGMAFYSRFRNITPLCVLLPFLNSAVCNFSHGWTRMFISMGKNLELGYIFFKIGAIIFGGGFAAIPFIKNEVVELRHWLTAKEFIDGVALGQITPGPVAITATFVGYKVSGIIGAIIATVAIFLPSFLMLIGLLHIYERIKEHSLVVSFLKGVRPAIVGMLLSAGLFIARNAIIDVKSGLLALLGLLVLWRFRLDPIWLILAGGVLGFVLV